MLLQKTNVIVYGAGGSLGGAVAKALAKEGARLFATGRKIDAVRKLAEEIIAAGGQAEAAEVDALDAKAVNAYLDGLVSTAGTLDVSFNAIGLQDRQDIPLTEMTLDDFLRPVRIAMETQFITSTAAGRLMKRQRSGVILSLTATPGGIGYPNVGGFGPACCAIEGFSRNLASELGPFGVRVVNIRSAGSPDSRVFREAIEQGGEKATAFLQKLKDDTMLKELPSMADIANVAAFLASALASKITGVTVDVTCGTTAALNDKLLPIAFVQR
jgi:NAD(P)-dependent dehydrogenase (short-subunit alcohol dehydrogenase family)